MNDISIISFNKILGLTVPIRIKSKTNKLIKKLAKDVHRHFSEEIHRWPVAHKKMLSITNQQENASQNHSEILSYTC